MIYYNYSLANYVITLCVRLEIGKKYFSCSYKNILLRTFGDGGRYNIALAKIRMRVKQQNKNKERFVI